MSERMKNILSAFIAVIIVAFIVFAIMYWLLKEDLSGAIKIAVAVAIGGWLAPILVNYIRKRKK